MQIKGSFNSCGINKVIFVMYNAIVINSNEIKFVSAVVVKISCKIPLMKLKHPPPCHNNIPSTCINLFKVQS